MPPHRWHAFTYVNIVYANCRLPVSDVACALHHTVPSISQTGIVTLARTAYTGGAVFINRNKSYLESSGAHTHTHKCKWIKKIEFHYFFVGLWSDEQNFHTQITVFELSLCICAHIAAFIDVSEWFVRAWLTKERKSVELIRNQRTHAYRRHSP